MRRMNVFQIKLYDDDFLHNYIKPIPGFNAKTEYQYHCITEWS